METLAKHFDTALDTPDGIKKLRELILTLAMKGKLVPQNPKDQPASELLKEIGKEQIRLINEEGLRTEASRSISIEEEFVGRPIGWTYCRLGNLAKFIDYRGRTPEKVDNGIPLITAKNVRFGYINREPYEYITPEEYDTWMTRGFPRKGDLLFTTEAPLGNIAVIDIEEKFALAQRVICFQLHNLEMGQFLKWLIMSKPFQYVLLLQATGMTATGIKGAKLKEIPIPIPPLAEQKRIVEKIDQLMSLCDKLETERNERDKKRVTVHTSAVNGLLNASDKPAFDKSWSFITKNFNELYSVTPNVAELKKAILQLAVMGKLVPQDKNDQPAGELLKMIQADASTRLSARVKKQVELPPIKPEEIPYQLPEGWVWCRLGEVGETNIGLTYSPKDLSNVGIPVLRSNNIQKGKLDLSDLVRVNIDVKDNVILKEGDLLICARNGSKALVGKTAQITGLTEKMAFGAFMAIFKSRCNDYILYYINSPLFRRMIDDVDTTTINQITQNNLKNTIFPLPPLAEQKRIVAKIDQLMELCNSLEQGIKDSTEKRSRVLGAVLARV